jgi:hypothetical protein
MSLNPFINNLSFLTVKQTTITNKFKHKTDFYLSYFFNHLIIVFQLSIY